MAAHQAPLSLGFSRQEHLPFPSLMHESEKWKWSQLCLTLSDRMGCSLPGSSTHGIFQARVLEWVAIAFSEYTVYICHSFSSKELVSFNFMAVVIIFSVSGAQENKICHCFHFFPIYLPWNDGTGCRDLSFLTVELKITSNTKTHLPFLIVSVSVHLGKQGLVTILLKMEIIF